MSALRRGARAAASLAVVLATVLALGGCGGIPISGPVVAGPAVDEVEPDYVVTPNGPAADADPLDILAGFMQAVRAPQSDFQVARKFLTPELALSWDPNAGVLIRTGSPTLAAVGTQEAPVVDYGFTTQATVDASGRYRAVESSLDRVLEFSFALVGDQWRISAAPNGIVLADASFERTFAAYALYFFDPSGRYLVPDVRWFPARQGTPSLVVGALLAGPDDWLRHAVVTDFPTGTALGARSVVVTGGRAAVDLSAQAASASAIELGRMRQQLIATLDVADATITVDGVPLQIPSSASAAVMDPQPSGSLLVGTPTEFGHTGASGIIAIPGVSEAVVADGARAVTLAPGEGSAVYLAADGTVRRVEDATATVVDARVGLVAPSIDEFGWTWSAGGGSPIEAFDRAGSPSGLIQTAIPPDASVVALAVSRDSTRIAVGIVSASGPRLLVFGIVRSDGVPTSLDPPLELSAPGAIASVAWVDDRSLIVVSDAAGVRSARVVALGAPDSPLGALPASAVAVGGSGGLAGVRAIADGIVLSPDGGDGWVDAGIVASYLGVQQ